MKYVASEEAESRMAQWISEAAEGEILVFTRNGECIAELRPCRKSRSRKRGMLRDQFGPLTSDFHTSLEEFSDYQ